MLKGKKAQTRGLMPWLLSNKDTGVKRSLKVRDARVEGNEMSGGKRYGNVTFGIRN